MRAADRGRSRPAPRRSSSWSAPARGLAAVTAQVVPRRGDRHRLRQGRQRRRRARGRAAPARAGPRRCGCCSPSRPRRSPATPPRTSAGCPATPPEPFAPAALEGARGASTRSSARAPPGRRAAPAGEARRGAERLGRCRCVAVDVPSGVDASHRARRRPAVHAAATATFPAAKPGLWIAPGQEPGRRRPRHRHRPRPARRPSRGRAARRRGARRAAARGPASTKFSSGHVLVAGGSRGLTGAPCLASMAAMRAGAGYVTALVPGRCRTSSRSACSRS